jgi:hypothetical protein
MAKKPTKPVPTGPRKITGTASSRKIVNKTLKPGSMVTKPKLVPTKPANPISFQGGQPAGYRNVPFAKAMGQGKLKRNTKNK